MHCPSQTSECYERSDLLEQKCWGYDYQKIEYKDYKRKDNLFPRFLLTFSICFDPYLPFPPIYFLICALKIIMNNEAQIQRRRKSRLKGEQTSFTCFLIYFVVKGLVLLIFYKYDNFLYHNRIYLLPFVTLLIANTYLMLTTGKDPGFQKSTIEENELLEFQKNERNFCEICNCRVKNRTKHCFYCGKCVRKYDHHCPWIGACVGEKNHAKFWLLLLTHTLQASLAFYICFESLGLYEYKFSDGHFSQQYGVFSVFAIFMLFYIGFAGGLLLFHSYLLLQNTTTRELTSRGKCSYLRNVRGNPFSRGVFGNIRDAIIIQQNGREWIIESPALAEEGPLSLMQRLWKNDYYSCC